MKTSLPQSSDQETIIPLDRPTKGRDLDLLRAKLGCSVKHMLSVLGISSRNKWQELTDEKGEEPLQDAALALLIRFYDRHPSFFPKEYGLTIGDVLANMANHAISMSASRFAVLVGRSKTVGPKWQTGTQPDPSANAAINIIDMLVNQDNLEYWVKVAEDEAKARGLLMPVTGESIQDRLGIPSWGSRKKATEKRKNSENSAEYAGIERRSKDSINSKLPPEIERRRTA